MSNEITVANLQADMDAAGRELELANSQVPATPDLVPDQPSSGTLLDHHVDGDARQALDTVRREAARPTPESIAAERELAEVPTNLRDVPVDDLAAFDRPSKELLSVALEAVNEALEEAGLGPLPKATRNTIISAIASLEEYATEQIEARDAEDKKRTAAEMQRQHRGELPSLLGDAAKCIDVMMPDRLRYVIENARDANGSLILNDASTLRWLSEIWRGRRELSPNSPRQRETNPSRKAEIEAIMKSDRSRYMRDEQMQAEYRRLLSQE